MTLSTIRRFQIKAVTVAVLASTSIAGYAQDRLLGLTEPVKAQTPFRIGVAVVHMQDDFYKGIVYGIEDEAKKVGAEVVQVSVAGAYGNVREQFAQLEALKALKVDVLAFAPAAFNGYDNALKSIKDAGITVAAVGIPVGSKNVDFGVLQNDSEIGAALAKKACSTGKTGEVLTIPGPAGAEWARLRYVGFMDELKKCNQLKPIEGAFGGSIDVQYGVAQTSDLLLKYPKAQYVYTPISILGMGAAQAIRQQRRNAEVLSSSLVKETIPMVKDGRFLGIVSEPGIIMGRLVVQFSAKKFNKEDIKDLKPADAGSPYPYFSIPPIMISKENADSHQFDLYDIPPKDWKLAAKR